MSLLEIKNKLYKKNLDAGLADHERSEFDPKNVVADSREVENFQKADIWQEGLGVPEENKKKALSVAAGILIAIAAIGLILTSVYYVRNSLFGEERVIVSISGPTESRSGKLLAYEVAYENKNTVSLNDVVLRIVHPENFKPEESILYQEESPTVSLVKIGKMDGHSGGKVFFSGKSYAPKGTLDYLKAELTYEPSNFSSVFVAKHQLGINITSTPISLEVLAPLTLASGNDLDYQINYKNIGEEGFDGLRIKVEYPEGFIFSKSEPNFSEGEGIWYVGNLSPGEEGKIIISGKLQGDSNVSKNVKAYVGAFNQGEFVSYNEETATTKIAFSPLSIKQTVNDSLRYFPNAGELLRFEIQYKNEGELGLKNLIVTEKIDNPVLDFETLEFDRTEFDGSGGAYDPETKTLMWKASDHKELASLDAGQGGTIRFSIKVKDRIPVDKENDKNFVISCVAKIDSPDIPTLIGSNKIIASNRMDMKLNSKIIMEMAGFYADTDISNSGPIPPAVEKETTYTIRLQAGNVSNDVTDAKMEIVLPTGVVATGKIYPGDAPISYNERTNQLIWSIGTIKSGEGILTPFREVKFQIKVKPSLDQADESIDIIKEAIFSANDSFTKEKLVNKKGSKNIMLKEDSTIEAVGWRVSK